MQKVLVVHFSRTGYTRRIATEIAARCGADVEELRDVRSRSGILGYLRSAREALSKRTIDIQPPARNPADYSLVVLGTPVWASNVCSPLRAYIVAHKDRFARVAFFCTQGGSGAQRVLDDMARLCGQTPAACLALNDAEIDGGRYAGKLDEFLRALALPQAA